MKIAKFSSLAMMTVLILGTVTSAHAAVTPDAASTSTLLLVSIGAMGVIYRNRKQAK